MEITRAAVVGAGTMGHGIAEVMALAGINVSLTDAYPEALEKARGMIAESVQKLAKSGKIKDDDARKTLARISYISDLGEAVKHSDLVLEAVPEDLNLKRKVFASIEKHAKKDAILATTTSN